MPRDPELSGRAVDPGARPSADAAPELLGFRLGTLDTDPGRTGGMHFMVDSKAPWLEIHDDLPREPGDGPPFGERD